MELAKVTNSCLIEYSGHFSSCPFISPLWSVSYYWLLFFHNLWHLWLLSHILFLAPSFFPTSSFLPCFSGFSLWVFYLSRPTLPLASAGTCAVALPKLTSPVHAAAWTLGPHIQPPADSSFGGSIAISVSFFSKIELLLSHFSPAFSISMPSLLPSKTKWLLIIFSSSLIHHL